jgi:hypothetical protein
MAAALAAAAVGAAAPAPPAPAKLSDAALAARLAYAAEIADQNRRSEALNAEVNRKNREVQAHNDALKAAFDRAMADYRIAVAQHDAAAAKVQVDYKSAMDGWKATVAACKAGDFAKCQAPPPAAPAQGANVAAVARLAKP